MHRHELTDEHWSAIEDLLPKRTATTGRPPSDPLLMLNGIFWILGTGAPWRDLLKRFGPWQTVYDHFATWRKAGVFARLVEALQVKLDAKPVIARPQRLGRSCGVSRRTPTGAVATPRTSAADPRGQPDRTSPVE